MTFRHERVHRGAQYATMILDLDRTSDPVSGRIEGEGSQLLSQWRILEGAFGRRAT